MEGRLKQFDAITAELKEIYRKKNIDYGDSFKVSLEKFGRIAYVVRAADKMLRLEQLVNNDAQVADEKFIDTVRDLANYSIMFLLHDKEGIVNDR
jgi:hypothetical protein